MVGHKESGGEVHLPPPMAKGLCDTCERVGSGKHRISMGISRHTSHPCLYVVLPRFMKCKCLPSFDDSSRAYQSTFQTLAYACKSEVSQNALSIDLCICHRQWSYKSPSDSIRRAWSLGGCCGPFTEPQASRQRLRHGFDHHTIVFT